MEKIKLNSEETKFLQDMREKQKEIGMMNLGVRSQIATFWQEFNGKHGMGNYKMNVEKEEIHKLSLEEVEKDSKKE